MDQKKHVKKVLCACRAPISFPFFREYYLTDISLKRSWISLNKRKEMKKKILKFLEENVILDKWNFKVGKKLFRRASDCYSVWNSMKINSISSLVSFQLEKQQSLKGTKTNKMINFIPQLIKIPGKIKNLNPQSFFHFIFRIFLCHNITNVRKISERW